MWNTERKQLKVTSKKEQIRNSGVSVHITVPKSSVI